MYNNDDVVDLALDLIRETDDAFLVSDGDVIAWLPKDHVYQQDDDEGVFTVPEWLAISRGLV